jgi:hypothetical protein
MADAHPIDGEVILQAGAFASVPLKTLSGLVRQVQQHIEDHRAEYDRQFECIDGEHRQYLLAPSEYWQGVAEELTLTDREIDAVRRVHETQFRRDGRRLGREDEFESALQIRSPVVAALE